jgi:hypothetical protein
MSRIGLLVAKDLRVLARSPALVVAVVLYPLLVAVLVGLVARFATDRPRVAFVDQDGVPDVLVVGGQEFEVARVLEQVEGEVDLVPLSEEEAARRLKTGEVVAAIVVPRGFVSRLRGMARSPTLTLKITRGGLAGRVERQTEALVYNLNRQLQSAYIEANLEYVRLIREGGSGDFLGNEFDIVGLEGAKEILADIEGRTDDPAVAESVRELQTFVDEALLALGQSGQTLRATANPIELRMDDEGRRSWLLSAQVQAYALALTLALVCALVAAVAIASERDENVIGRLARGLVRLEELVAAKVALTVVVAVALGIVLAAFFGLAVELAGSATGEPWARLPLLALGLALAGGAFGAFGVLLGVLAREARTASLLAFLVALPVVLLGFLPEVAVAPAAWFSNAFPFVHAVRIFESSLYDVEPWGTLGREGAWLLALGAAYATAARIGVRRLLA